MIVLLLGAPGIGKTTILHTLGNRLQCPYLELSLVPEFRVIAGREVSYATDEEIAIENLVLWAGNYLRHGHQVVLLSDFRLESVPSLRRILMHYHTMSFILVTSDVGALVSRVSARETGFRDVAQAVAYNEQWTALDWPTAAKVDVTGKSVEEVTEVLINAIMAGLTAAGQQAPSADTPSL